MTENSPEAPRPGQPPTDPEPTPPEPTSKPKAGTGSGRFAVYDNRYLRFVGGVSDSKPTKAEAKKLAGHDDVEIREV